MNCVDDLTSVDVQASAPGTVATSSTSSTVSLFPYILHDQSTGFNLAEPAHLPRVLRPLDSKDVAKGNEELEGTEEAGGVWSAGSLDSQEDDDEVIIHVRFSELVRIKSILIGTGGGRAATASQRVKVWANRIDGVSFDMVQDVKPEQEWELLEGPNGETGAVEYPVRITKFANCSSVDLFLSHARGTSSRLFYLGFMGEARQLKKEPGDLLSIGAENAVNKMIDGVKEEKRGSSTVK